MAEDDMVRITLHEAARSRRVDLVEACISTGDDVNAMNGRGDTPLHIALDIAGNPDAVEVLVAAGADPNAKNAEGEAPLHRAAFWPTHHLPSHLKAIEALIAAGADPNAKDAKGTAPLHHAVRAHHYPYEVAKTLIAAGADVSARTDDGTTPLHDADGAEVVEELIAAGANVNARKDDGTTPLHRAVCGSAADGRSDLQAVEALIAAGVNVNARTDNGTTPLHSAAGAETVEALIAAGANVNARTDDGITPLHRAVGIAGEGPKEAEALIAAGADLNAKDDRGKTPLHHAVGIGGGRLKEAEALISAGAYVNTQDDKGITPLMVAVANDDPGVMQQLVSAGADPNLPNNHHLTPLHFAAARGTPEIVRILVSIGADFNAQDDEGITPLMVAVSRPNLGTMQELVAAGADSNLSDKDRLSPLHFAAVQGMDEMVRILVAAGAELDARSRDSLTPLGAALIHCKDGTDRLGVAQELISAGANPNLSFPTLDNETALHLAARTGDLALVEALLSAGTDADPKNNTQQTPTDVADSDDIREALRTFRDAEPSASTSPQSASQASPKPVTQMLYRTTPVAAPVGNKPRVPFIPFRKKEEQMTTMSMIGAPGAGKTHVAALLYIHLLTHQDINISVSSYSDHEHNVMRAAGDLAWGIPLEPTPREVLASSELRVTFQEDVQSRFRGTKREEREVLIPVMDSAGELLNAAMTVLLEAKGGIAPAVLAERLRELNFEPRFVNDLFNHVFRSDAFCFVLDASRVFGGKDRTREFEHVTFLDNLRKFRRAQNLPMIRNAMLVLTKYDVIRTSLDDAVLTGMYGGGLHNRDILAHYLCPALKSQLDGAVKEGDGNPVKVVLSSTEWAKKPMSDEEIEERYGDGISGEQREEYAAGRFEYKVLPNGTRAPVYDEAEYEEIVSWLKSL